MVSYCIAFGCKNRFSNDRSDIRFHRFPLSKKELCKKWILAVRRANWTPNAGSRICSEHFLETDYKPKCIEGRWKLKKDAVPSVFNFLPLEKKKCSVNKNTENLEIEVSDGGHNSSLSENECLSGVPILDEETDNLPETEESNHFETERSNKLEYSDTHTVEIVHNNLSFENESSSEVSSLEEVDNLTEMDESDHLITEKNNELEYSNVHDTQIVHKYLLKKIKSPEVLSLLQTVTNCNVTLVDAACQTTNNVFKEHYVNNLLKKIKTLQQKVRRQENKIEEMKLIIKNVKSQGHSPNKVTNIQSNCFFGEPLMLVVNGVPSVLSSESNTQ